MTDFALPFITDVQSTGSRRILHQIQWTPKCAKNSIDRRSVKDHQANCRAEDVVYRSAQNNLSHVTYIVLMNEQSRSHRLSANWLISYSSKHASEAVGLGYRPRHRSFGPLGLVGAENRVSSLPKDSRRYLSISKICLQMEGCSFYALACPA